MYYFLWFTIFYKSKPIIFLEVYNSTIITNKIMHKKLTISIFFETKVFPINYNNKEQKEYIN